jgi:hydroxymethylglutaryl-CoA reductase (NADPH)
VDITTPGLRSVLNALVDASTADLPRSSDDITEDEDAARDMLVKVAPPIYVRVVLPPSMLPSAKHASLGPSKHGLSDSYLHHSISTRKDTSELLDAFMSSWTRLVGDPILSKWIVVMLAISVGLNGYLLKGIAAGVVGTRFGGMAPVSVKGGVRFEDVGEEKDEEEEEKEKEKEPVVVSIPSPPIRAKEPVSPAAIPTIGTFTLEEVDKRLQSATAARISARRTTITSRSSLSTSFAVAPPLSTSSSGATVVANMTPPSSSSDSSSDVADQAGAIENVRSLAECLDIFDNGPRPLSESLVLLNDEEIILLALKGKIAAYALEKVLGMNELERAVRIRRALICTFFFSVFSFFLLPWLTYVIYFSSCIADADTRVF